MNLDPNDHKIIRDPSVYFNQIDDELVLFDQRSGKYFQVNAVGARIWELLEQPITINELVSALLAEFDVEPDVCGKETNDFITQAASFRFVTILDDTTT